MLSHRTLIGLRFTQHRSAAMRWALALFLRPTSTQKNITVCGRWKGHVYCLIPINLFLPFSQLYWASLNCFSSSNPCCVIAGFSVIIIPFKISCSLNKCYLVVCSSFARLSGHVIQHLAIQFY